MTTTIDGGMLGIMSLALDAATMRQQAIARNIANANTPGYARAGVSFEQRLDALRGTIGTGQAPSLSALTSARPRFETVGNSGDAVALDMEMAALSENTLHHQTLLKLLNKHFALIGSAINEGKR